MGDVVGDLPQALHQGGDAVEHAIEGDRKPVEIVVRAANRNAAGQVAVDDRLRRAAHRCEAPVQVVAEAIAPGDADHDHPREGPEEAFQHGLLQRLGPLVVIADDQAIAFRQSGGVDPYGLRLPIGLPQGQLGPPQGRASACESPGHGAAAGRLQTVFQRPGGAVALAHGLDDALQAFLAKLLAERHGLGVDAGIELLLERGAGGQEGDGAEHHHRNGEGRRVDRRKPQADGAEHQSGALRQ